jgi:hypothetical protein
MKTSIEHPKASTPAEFDEQITKFKCYYTLLGKVDALTNRNHPDSAVVACLMNTNLSGSIGQLASVYDNAADLWSALTKICTQDHKNNHQRNLDAHALFEVQSDETLLDAYTRLRRLQNSLIRAGDVLTDEHFVMTFIRGLRSYPDYSVECTLLRSKINAGNTPSSRPVTAA